MNDDLLYAVGGMDEDEAERLSLKDAYRKGLEEFGEESDGMRDEREAAEQKVALVACHNHESRLAATTGPGGEPLCEPCAVALAKRLIRQAKLAKKAKNRGRLAPSVKSR